MKERINPASLDKYLVRITSRPFLLHISTMFDLENKLLNAAATRDQIKVDHVSDPAVPWVSDTRKDTKAIHEEPITYASGRMTFVSLEKCFRYFAEYYGCSICIKVCPFNNTSYDKLKQTFQRKAQG